MRAYPATVAKKISASYPWKRFGSQRAGIAASIQIAGLLDV
jgi:hypothetical protein